MTTAPCGLTHHVFPGDLSGHHRVQAGGEGGGEQGHQTLRLLSTVGWPCREQGREGGEGAREGGRERAREGGGEGGRECGREGEGGGGGGGREGGGVGEQ